MHIYIHYRPLHIAVVQCNTAMSLKLIRVMVLADKGLNIYNNLRQVTCVDYKK